MEVLDAKIIAITAGSRMEAQKKGAEKPMPSVKTFEKAPASLFV